MSSVHFIELLLIPNLLANKRAQPMLQSMNCGLRTNEADTTSVGQGQHSLKKLHLIEFMNVSRNSARKLFTKTYIGDDDLRESFKLFLNGQHCSIMQFSYPA